MEERWKMVKNNKQESTVLRGNMISVRPNGTRRVRFMCTGPTMTEQHHRNEVNINQIMKRARMGGLIPMRAGTPLYGDFRQATDYHDMKNRVIEADRAFLKLPASIRAQFDNDPGALIAYLDNPENLQEAIEMGLVDPSRVEDQVIPDKPTERNVEAKEGQKEVKPDVETKS